MLSIRRASLLALACLALATSAPAQDAWSRLRNRLTERLEQLPEAQAAALRTVMQGEALAEVLQSWEHAKIQATEEALRRLEVRPAFDARDHLEHIRSRKAIMQALAAEDPEPGSPVLFLDYSGVVLDQGGTAVPGARSHILKAYEGDLVKVRTPNGTEEVEVVSIAPPRIGIDGSDRGVERCGADARRSDRSPVVVDSGAWLGAARAASEQDHGIRLGGGCTGIRGAQVYRGASAGGIRP